MHRHRDAMRQPAGRSRSPNKAGVSVAPFRFGDVAPDRLNLRPPPPDRRPHPEAWQGQRRLLPPTGRGSRQWACRPSTGCRPRKSAASSLALATRCEPRHLLPRSKEGCSSPERRRKTVVAAAAKPVWSSKPTERLRRAPRPRSCSCVPRAPASTLAWFLSTCSSSRGSGSRSSARRSCCSPPAARSPFAHQRVLSRRWRRSCSVA